VLALEGIRVVALEHAVAGPLCTRHLADLGADVIKIERVGEGDFARGYDEYVKGLSSFFVWLNRGKRSLTLDVKHAEGREVLDRLTAQADIVVQNLAPGAAARLGLSHAELSVSNPRAIVVDISGYGEGGPYENRKAYDMLIQAESGVVSVTGSEAEPSRVGLSMVDMATGVYAYSGALAALVARGRTGVGSNVTVAMFDAMAEWMAYPLYRYGYDGSLVERAAMTHPVITPYGAFAATDGDVVFSIQNEREWTVFCQEMLGNAAFATDPRFRNNTMRRQNAGEVKRLIEEAFSKRSSRDVVEHLERIRIANARLNTAKDLWEHPQLSERDRWRDIGSPAGPLRALLPPVNFSQGEVVMGDVPTLGQHTDEILIEFGFNIAQIDAMRARGVV
jgi:itaconate CoA-transferase